MQGRLLWAHSTLCPSHTSKSSSLYSSLSSAWGKKISLQSTPIAFTMPLILFTDVLYFPVPSLCSIFSLFFLPCIPLLKWANKSFLDPIISYSVISASSSLHYTLLERIVFIHCQHFVTCPIPHSTLCRPHCLPLHSLSRMAGTFQPTTLHTTPLPGILSHTWPC